MNKNAILSEIQVRPIDVSDLLTTLFVAFAIGLVIVAVYRISHRGLTYERSFLVTLVMMAPIVALVMMLIGSNLALSLGLVGALSIIRFRNVIRDSRDMVYLFWGVAVGLSCGTFNWSVAAIASVFIGVILLTLHWMQFGIARQSESILVVRGTGDTPGERLAALISQFATMSNLRSLEIEGSDWEIVYEVRIHAGNELDQQKLLKAINEMDGVQRASLMAPHLSLPV